MSKVFVVTMYRFGNKEAHSYIKGVFDDLEKAKQSGANEYYNRGSCKYIPFITEHDINKADGEIEIDFPENEIVKYPDKETIITFKG